MYSKIERETIIMENKKLLIDTIPFDIAPEQINESLEKNSGRLIVKGKVQEADTENQNGRKYPKDVLLREVDKYKGTFIKERRALGELDHPDTSVVELKNTSHQILDLWWDNNEVWAKIEVLSTPAGNILKELFKSNIRLGISSRGLGSVKESAGSVEVQDDFEIICWDFVSNPSTYGAFMDEKVNEGVDHSNANDDKLKEINNTIVNILKLI